MKEVSHTDIEQLIVELMQVIVKRQFPIELSYFVVASTFCRLAQAMGRTVEQIISDIEVTFKSLPQPIEDKDESHQ